MLSCGCEHLELPCLQYSSIKSGYMWPYILVFFCCASLLLDRSDKVIQLPVSSQIFFLLKTCGLYLAVLVLWCKSVMVLVLCFNMCFWKIPIFRCFSYYLCWYIHIYSWYIYVHIHIDQTVYIYVCVCVYVPLGPTCLGSCVPRYKHYLHLNF